MTEPEAPESVPSERILEIRREIWLKVGPGCGGDPAFNERYRPHLHISADVFIESILRYLDEQHQAGRPAPTSEPAEPRGGTRVRGALSWQCSGCAWGFHGKWQKVCPACGCTDYWTGSVHPDALAWDGTHGIPSNHPKYKQPSATHSPAAGLERALELLDSDTLRRMLATGDRLDLRSAVSAAIVERDSLRKTLTERESEAAKFAGERDEARRQLAERNRELASRIERLQLTGATLELVEKERAALRSELTALQAKVSRTEAFLASQPNLEAELVEVRGRLAAWERQVDAPAVALWLRAAQFMADETHAGSELNKAAQSALLALACLDGLVKEPAPAAAGERQKDSVSGPPDSNGTQRSAKSEPSAGASENARGSKPAAGGPEQGQAGRQLCADCQHTLSDHIQSFGVGRCRICECGGFAEPSGEQAAAPEQTDRSHHEVMIKDALRLAREGIRDTSPHVDDMRHRLRRIISALGGEP